MQILKANLNLYSNLNNSSNINQKNAQPTSFNGFSHSMKGGVSSDTFELSNATKKSALDKLINKIKNIFNLKPAQKASIETQANNQINFTGKKKDYTSNVIYSKDQASAQAAKEKYFTTFNTDIKEAQLTLDMIDEDLVKEIKSTHDIFSAEELCNMQDAKESADNFAISDIVKNRGSYARLAQKEVKNETDSVLTKELSEYVNRYVEFCSQKDSRLALSTKRIEELISRYGKAPQERTLYRGVLDDFEILRLFKLLEAKEQNPNETILYRPKRLTSVTKNQEVTAKTYGQKCMLEIEIPQNSDKESLKLLDINEIFKKLNLKRNKFDYQEEILIGTKNSFIIKGLKFVNNIPTFIVQLTKSGV